MWKPVTCIYCTTPGRRYVVEVSGSKSPHRRWRDDYDATILVPLCIICRMVISEHCREAFEPGCSYHDVYHVDNICIGRDNNYVEDEDEEYIVFWTGELSMIPELKFLRVEKQLAKQTISELYHDVNSRLHLLPVELVLYVAKLIG